MRLPIQVAIHCYRETDHGREYLLLRRRADDGDYWQEPTGGVESGEAIDAAARRELRKETRFDPLGLEPIGFVYTHPVAPEMKLRHNFTNDHLTVHVYAAQIPDGVDPAIDSSEHVEFRWCSLEDALSILYWEEDRVAVKRVEGWVESAGN